MRLTRRFDGERNGLANCGDDARRAVAVLAGLRRTAIRSVGMARVLVPLPDRDFDLTETAVPWRMLTRAGHDVVFATRARRGAGV